MSSKRLETADLRMATIGLDYVGLPLAMEFGKKRPVVAFDINRARVDELKSGQDHTVETIRWLLRMIAKKGLRASLCLIEIGAKLPIQLWLGTRCVVIAPVPDLAAPRLCCKRIFQGWRISL